MPKNLLERGLTAPWQKKLAREYPKASNAFELELIAFRIGTEHGRFFHMHRLVDFMFTKEGNPDIIRPVDWNPWTERFLEVACDGDLSLGFTGEPKYLGVTGPASSSKTFSAALYAFLTWYANPRRTKVVVASTSIQAAKNRIWANIVQLANAVPEQLRFYDILTSNPAMIRLPNGTNVESVELIAGDDSQREASDKVLGIKNDYFLMIVDEATEVSHALFEARNNLDKNPRLQMIFLGNAASHEDPHGKICEPLNGWESITVESEIWQTNLPRGACLHFDGLKSPNMLAPEGEPAPYPRLITREAVQEVAQTEGGDQSAGFWRFTRGFWPKSGSSSQIYTVSDIELNGGKDAPIWLEPPKRIMGHDPSFSSDGDRSMAVICDLGLTPEKIPILAHVATEVVAVDETQKERYSFAMAEQLKRLAEKYDIDPNNIGVDCTGSGLSYPDVIDEVFNKDKAIKSHCWRVAFNGPTSGLPYPTDALMKNSEDMFDRRVSEIWYIGKLFLQKGQFRGLKSDLVNEMCKRLYERVKQNKISVETKRKMRERGIKSPDEPDAFFIALALAREKLGFSIYTGPSTPRKPVMSFKEWAKKMDPGISHLDGMRGGWSTVELVR